MLETIVVDPQGTPTATVIWLHGLGASGHDFEPIIPMLELSPDLPIRFVFPHAPVRPVTINGGMQMRAWYDIFEITIDRRVDLEALIESADEVVDLLEIEVAGGMPSHRIVLAGFSQGGAVALHAGLRYPNPLAGILALSTYMPTFRTLEVEANPENRQIPILMAHGTMDPTVPVSNGLSARQELTRLGYDVQWHEYPMMHQVCEEEILDIGHWLTEVLA